MNEDARNEKSSVGKAINTAIMGAGAYGLHKGVTSDKAYNWAANQRNNAVANGVLKYNQYTDEFKKYDSLDKLLELCKSRGQKISHNNTYNDIEGINQIIIEIAAGFRCVDDISNLDISDKTTNYKECWKFWLDGIN